MKTLITTLVSAVILSAGLFAQQQKISRIEPPNWWTGMKHSKVQLLIHGKDIAALHPSTDYPGVFIDQIIKVENPNYLFVDVRIEVDAQPGSVKFDFSKDNHIVESHKWQLWEREKNGEDYLGFDNSDVMYLITPDRFANGDPTNDDMDGMKEKANREFKGGRHGGDIEGIRKNLDYLQDMGFTAIWLNPVLENDMHEYSYHGYSTTDFYKVDPRFGTNESYRQLSKEASEKGIKLIMDLIVNHCGSEHWWMDDLPTHDWLNTWEKYTVTNHRKTLSQDPYGSKYDRKLFFDGWFYKTMPDLNQRNPLMATYLNQVTIWWIEYANLAGIRMDTYPYPDMHYMTDWTETVMEEYPNFNIVGEEWNGNPAIVAYWQKGKQNANGYTSELKSLMDFPLQEALHDALIEKESWGKGWLTLYQALALDFIYADPYNLVVFPDNHDMPRFYAQMGEDVGLFKLGLAYILTTRGIPQLYYGTEVLMNSPSQRDDGLIRSDFPGGWDGDPVNGFSGSGLSKQQQEVQSFLKQLLNWRKTASAIHNGQLLHFDPVDGVYVFFRFNQDQKLMIILNKNEQSYDLAIDRFKEVIGHHTEAVDILTSERRSLTTSVSLPAKSPLILEIK